MAIELVLNDIILRLAIAAIFGALVGLERELRGISAGLKTHALVCFGACLFTIVSLQFSVLDERVDIARIAAGVVTGIGFLGAGAIFFDRRGIHGLTTAANIWAVAALGLIVGLGQYEIALSAAIIIYIILVFGALVERKLIKKSGRKR